MTLLHRRFWSAGLSGLLLPSFGVKRSGRKGVRLGRGEVPVVLLGRSVWGRCRRWVELRF